MSLDVLVDEAEREDIEAAEAAARTALRYGGLGMGAHANEPDWRSAKSGPAKQRDKAEASGPMPKAGEDEAHEPAGMPCVD